MIRRIVPEAVVVPWWLGLAYWRWDREEAVCYPIPVNLIVRWARNGYFWLKATHRPDWIRQQTQDRYDRGFHNGVLSELHRQLFK